MAANANSENTKCRIEASSAEKRKYGAKENESSTGRTWVAVFHHVTARSRLAGVLKLINRLFL
jgi:hypothetical protein